VDKAKIEVIAKLLTPKCVKDIRSFLGHARFYHRFIKDFSKIARPLTNLLAKNVPFIFNDECLNSWEKLEMELISAPIISAPDWSKPFEIMCDASDFVIGVVLGQCIDNKQHVIYYSSRTLNEAQLNYTTTEKEFLAVVFVLKKISSIYTWDQNHNIQRPFCTSIPNAQEGRKGLTHSLDPPPSRV